MSNSQSVDHGAGDLSREEMLSVLFAQMVIQQANLAMMLLGEMPHPESGEKLRDIEGARLFIDQLEMLEAKTKGNLSREEAALLKQSLMSLQLAFVKAVEAPAPPAPAPAPAATPPAPETAPAETKAGAESPAAGSSAAEADPKKKYSKKY